MPTRSREEYFNLPLKVDESSGTIGKMFVLVIYDISDNRRRGLHLRRSWPGLAIASKSPHSKRC